MIKTNWHTHISYLTDRTIALKYTGINGVEHFIIDITVISMGEINRYN